MDDVFEPIDTDHFTFVSADRFHRSRTRVRARSDTVNNVTTSTSRIWLDETDGIVHLEPRARRKEELADAIENVNAVFAVSGRVRRPLLVHFQSAVALSPECRAYYTSAEAARSVTAIAIVTSSTMGRIIGNLMIGMHPAQVPSRLFDDVEGATEWLKTVRPRVR